MGTLLNSGLIIVGAIAGGLFGKKITTEVADGMQKALGLAVLILGLGGTMTMYLSVSADGSLETKGTMMMILSLALGTIIGELLKIESWFVNFGEWLKVKSKNEKDKTFVEGFVSATCIVCIGAMGIVGAIQDGISGDYSTLLAKGLLDMIIVCIMTPTLGKGCGFSAIPVFILQGFFYVLTLALGSFIPEAAFHNLNLVGDVLIVCIGINLIWDLKIRVANMLPSLIIAMLWIFLPILQ